MLLWPENHGRLAKAKGGVPHCFLRPPSSARVSSIEKEQSVDWLERLEVNVNLTFLSLRM